MFAKLRVILFSLKYFKFFIWHRKFVPLWYVSVPGLVLRISKCSMFCPKSWMSLNENKGHHKNEVWVNSDRIKYADQFLLTKLDEIVTGLWENQGFWRPTIAIYGAAYASFIQFYLFCWKVRKNTANALVSRKVSLSIFSFVWLLMFKEFFEKFK